MLKLVLKFAKVVLLTLLLMVINPHRTVLLIIDIIALLGSWFAGKLENVCQWTADKVAVAKKKVWWFGKPIHKIVSKDIQEVHEMLEDAQRKIDAKAKGEDDV